MRLVLSLFLVFFARAAIAHDPLLDLPAPTSVPEAWNVITQSVANIDECLETRQLKEVSFHVANCSPAIRVLQADVKGDRARVEQLEALYYSGDAIITATREKEDAIPRARAAYEAHRQSVRAVAALYKPDVVNAAVYVCVHHPLERSVDPATPCAKCSMKLIPRRIPASMTYERPGAPWMKLEARSDRPLEVGKAVTVTINLTRVKDGKPVTPRDLLVMHTERIHLLIVDASLDDYHHEHPKPMEGMAGVYAFTFTPRKPGPYRIFADVVPVITSRQEYVVADLPAETDGEPVGDKRSRLTGEGGAGLRFSLTFDVKATEVQSGRPIPGTLTVSGLDGKPFNQLQPVMGAFAHLVAYSEDRRTVLHVHPEGPEVKEAEARGGPILKFKLYAPQPGFYRLYAQVQVNGAQVFVPFNVRILPPG
jgi:hypothetical protein